MFDFEKLEVYKKVVHLNTEVLNYLFRDKQLDKDLKDQLKRATISVALNIAEGAGRVGVKDKRHFYVMARASVHESVALLQILKSQLLVTESDYEKWYREYEGISKMLFQMIRNIKKFK